MSDYDLQRSHWVGQKLTQKLGPEYISTRSGGGGKLSYIEGWKVINIANEVFNHDGWSSSVVSLQQDYCDQLDPQGQRFNVGFSAIVRITLRSGAYHEDVGFGQMDNARGKGMAFDKARRFAGKQVCADNHEQCKKEAITDGLKRALRYFGNLTGNCVYDKNYTSEISKIKVQPVRAS
ncbi:Rad52/22 double-strand break repair protein [Auriculariales sp. MPI-PUGE-AT-0066]|nr:Rad52/22 double-strand break repair protein [Auriculariales sp. MPI-PUGE-AT-0066]